MVDLVNKKCAHEGGTKAPSLGIAGSKKLGRVLRRTCQGGHGEPQGQTEEKCAHQGCTKQPSFGIARSTK